MILHEFVLEEQREQVGNSKEREVSDLAEVLLCTA